MMTATVIGDEALAAKFTAAVATLNAEKLYWMHDVGLMVEEAIEGNIARQGLIDTGNLIDSGRVFNQTKNGISVGFGKGTDYAQALEFGSRPHTIQAGGISGSTRSHTEGGKFTYSAPGMPGLLSFYWQSRGEWFIGPSVNHPGNKPYRFVYRGTLESVYPIMLYFAKRLREIFGGM